MGLKARQALPYTLGLLFLAWALGSLARSGGGSGGLLLNSYWLLYIVVFLPVIALGIMVMMVVYLALQWKLLSDALGFSIARKRKQRKTSRTAQVIIWFGAWAIALSFLLYRCGGIFCSSTSQNRLILVLKDQVAGANSAQVLPQIGGTLTSVTGFVSNRWFAAAFLGLLIVSTAVLVRSLKVSLEVTKEGAPMTLMVQEKGREAVRDALRVLDEESTEDPRTRIIACYQRMIQGAANLGAPVSSTQTARELEAGIRNMFMLTGPEIRELTQLFEEARYSLHPITEVDSEKAHDCLKEIAEELRVATSIQA